MNRESVFFEAFLSKKTSGDFACSISTSISSADSCSFTFTGKEKDSESGYHYFGARYYDCEALTGWLSVDPMADRYPSISPYAYCAWNPAKLVDPDGRMFGDYYGTKGNYLGWDGNNDNQVYIVGNKADVNRIKNNDKNRQTTSVSDLQSKPILRTSYGVLREACNVLERAETNSNQTKEECSVVDFEIGLSVRSKTGEPQSADLPEVPDWMSDPVSIHSHNKYNDATQMSGHHADNSGDADHFGDFVQNVIVGPIGVGGAPGLCFYRNASETERPIHSLPKSTAKKIIGQQTIRIQKEINKASNNTTQKRK